MQRQDADPSAPIVMTAAAAAASPSDEEPTSIFDLYKIDLVPSELFLKFRKEIEGFRAGVNLEEYCNPCVCFLFCNFHLFRKDPDKGNDYRAKLVLKPLTPDRRWKFIYEPLHGDIRLLSNKISLTKYLNLQVGIGHSFPCNAIGWTWKLSTCLGGDGISQIRNKSSIGLFPGFDLRIGWRADYILPAINGALGTGEPVVSMNYGRLQASLDRVEAIVTT